MNIGHLGRVSWPCRSRYATSGARSRPTARRLRPGGAPPAGQAPLRTTATVSARPGVSSWQRTDMTERPLGSGPPRRPMQGSSSSHSSRLTTRSSWLTLRHPASTSSSASAISRVTAAGDGRAALARRLAARRSRSAGSRTTTNRLAAAAAAACRRVRPSGPRAGPEPAAAAAPFQFRPLRSGGVCVGVTPGSSVGGGRLPDLVRLLGAFLTWPLRRGRRHGGNLLILLPFAFRLTLLHPIIPARGYAQADLVRCR